MGETPLLVLPPLVADPAAGSIAGCTSPGASVPTLLLLLLQSLLLTFGPSSCEAFVVAMVESGVALTAVVESGFD